MKRILVALAMVGLVPAIALGGQIVAQAKTDTSPKTDTSAMPAVGEAKLVTLRGTVEAIDKDKQTVTLKGSKGKTLTVKVRDPQKLDAINVGDPVIGKYYESLMIAVKKPGEGTPGVTSEKATVGSKPGEVPAGAIGQQVTVTATIVAIDKKAQTATIKGPEGNTVTVKARDPKNLDKVKVGDNVDITYTEALAISLDKPAKSSKK